MSDILLKKYVAFRIGRELYALNITHVKKIEDTKDIREIPNTDVEVKGIIDFQGEQIVPIVDLRTLFNIHNTNDNHVPFIIISNVNDVWIGFIVDEVDEVIEINEKDISLGNLTETISSESSEYIQGIYRKKGETEKDEKLLIILNADKLIERKKLQSLKEISKHEE